MIDQGGNGYAHGRPSGQLSRSRFGWGTLVGGIAIALVASPNYASAKNLNNTIHANVLVTNSALGSGGLGGQLLGYSAGQKNAQKPVTTLSGGSNFLIGPSGVDVDLFVGLECVTSGLANLVTCYQLGANGNTGPAAPPFSNPLDPTTGKAQAAATALPLNLDTGIAPEPNLNVPPEAADSNQWVTNISPLVCINSNLATCNATSPKAPDVCGSGSLVQWAIAAPSPSLMIGGCPAGGTNPELFSDVIAPIGVFVDDVPVTVCEPASANPDLSQGNCEAGQVENTDAEFATPRIWAVESGLGAVTLHVPAVAEAAGLSFATTVQFPLSATTPPPTSIFVAQPPIGGFFATTTDGLLPAPAGDSVDTTSPKYIALGAAEGEAYITDTALGPRRKATRGEFGRIKEFTLSSTPTQFCVEFDLTTTPPTCTEWFQIPVVAGTFETTIEGRGTKLNVPQGIVAFTIPGASGDFIMVANTGSNTVTEYAPGASGNAKPDAILSGPGAKVHTLDLPVGLALTPVP
jgi:hypothetical protein